MSLPVRLNEGVSFGLKVNQVEIVAGVVIFLLLAFLKKKFSWGLYLMVCGGLINLIDRLMFGSVRDYFDMGLFYNNLADVAIFVGLVVILRHAKSRNSI